MTSTIMKIKVVSMIVNTKSMLSISVGISDLVHMDACIYVKSLSSLIYEARRQIIYRWIDKLDSYDN